MNSADLTVAATISECDVAKMNDLSAITAAYIAGLVDADGTVSLARKHANENRHPVVSISNTDRLLLQYVLDQIGAGKITGKRTISPRHSPSFTYAIYNRQALKLLIHLVPYLKTYKAKRAKLIVDEYLTVTPRNGKYTAESRVARQQFERQILGTRP
jgi:LAGLIDADG-like domain